MRDNEMAAPVSSGPLGTELHRVIVFQANVKLQSGKVVQMIVPADITDADVLDLIMEIAKNISATARQESARSLLTVPAGPLSTKS